jgi:hypothetical protein
MPVADPPPGTERGRGRGHPRRQPGNDENGSRPAQSKSKVSKKRKKPEANENLHESTRASKRTRGNRDSSFLDPFAMSDSLRNEQGETHHSWEPPYSVQQHEEMSSHRSLGPPAVDLGDPSPALASPVPEEPALPVIDPALLNAPPPVPTRHPRMPEDRFFAAAAVSASSHSQTPLDDQNSPDHASK